MEEEPESIGSKDSFQDNFDKWLERQDTSEMIKYADKWGVQITK
jgi:hypothetical protein